MHMHRDNHGSPWRLVYDTAQFTFSTSGLTVKDWDPLTNKEIEYTTAGGEPFKTPEQKSEGSVNASVNCSTTSPRNQKIVISIRASFSINEIGGFYSVANKSMGGTASRTF